MQTLSHYFRETDVPDDLAALLTDVSTVCKRISHDVRRAGILGILGEAGSTSHQGEEQKKLDLVANDLLVAELPTSGQLCVIGSEEDQEPIPVPPDCEQGPFAIVFDPLDGSSNIDANVSIGTIFGIYRRTSTDGPGTAADLLQPGRSQVAAGYVLYGPSTMLVVAVGDRVDGFTLDPDSGEYIRSHRDIRTPERGKIYAINETNAPLWDSGTRSYVETVKARGYRGRYVGSLVADFHRTLLYGGIFLYPADHTTSPPTGKLRLLYEGNPLAYVARAAGAIGTTGTERILDIAPTDLHQRVSLVLGSREDAEAYEAAVAAG